MTYTDLKHIIIIIINNKISKKNEKRRNVKSYRPTDRPTDRPMDRVGHRVACKLKKIKCEQPTDGQSGVQSSVARDL